jgi:TolB protein
MVAVALIAVGSAPKVEAAFPGVNGRIVYVAGQDIITINPDGTDKRLVITIGEARAAALSPVWSPDGTRIAYITYSTQGRFLYVINADGTDNRLITNDALEPTWSPDGTRIAFIRQMHLFTMNADGTGATQLTFEAGFNYAHEPEWSPDGSLIAFVRYENEAYRVLVIRPDGTGEIALFETSGLIGSPAWSPDSQMLTVAAQGCPGPEMFRVSRGGGATTLPDNGVDENHVGTSPDGKRLVFDGGSCAEATPYVAGDIFVSDVFGSAPKNITNTPNISESDPDWQRLPRPPAGTKLRIEPTIGPPGFVATAIGTGFPPNTYVTLAWRFGLGTWTVRTKGNGTFSQPVLIFHHDLLGPRQLVATNFPAVAGANFLAVPASIQPRGFVVRR